MCTGLKLQNFKRPITSHFICSRKRYASFSDISLYLTWAVVFEVFPLMRISSEITLSFLPGACHDMSSFLKKILNCINLFRVNASTDFPVHSFYLKASFFSHFTYHKSFLSWRIRQRHSYSFYSFSS